MMGTRLTSGFDLSQALGTPGPGVLDAAHALRDDSRLAGQQSEAA